MAVQTSFPVTKSQRIADAIADFEFSQKRYNIESTITSLGYAGFALMPNNPLNLEYGERKRQEFRYEKSLIALKRLSSLPEFGEYLERATNEILDQDDFSIRFQERRNLRFNALTAFMTRSKEERSWLISRFAREMRDDISHSTSLVMDCLRDAARDYSQHRPEIVRNIDSVVKSDSSGLGVRFSWALQLEFAQKYPAAFEGTKYISNIASAAESTFTNSSADIYQIWSALDIIVGVVDCQDKSKPSVYQLLGKEPPSTIADAAFKLCGNSEYNRRAAGRRVLLWLSESYPAYASRISLKEENGDWSVVYYRGEKKSE